MARPDPLFLQPGDLRHQVSFAHPAAAQDTSGQSITTWTPYLTTRAHVENLSGQQNYQASQFTSEALWRITLRFRHGIAVGDRCFFGAQVFVVQILNNRLQRGRVLDLTCLEIDGSS